MVLLGEFLPGCQSGAGPDDVEFERIGSCESEGLEDERNSASGDTVANIEQAEGSPPLPVPLLQRRRGDLDGAILRRPLFIFGPKGVWRDDEAFGMKIGWKIIESGAIRDEEGRSLF